MGAVFANKISRRLSNCGNRTLSAMRSRPAMMNPQVRSDIAAFFRDHAWGGPFIKRLALEIDMWS
jgi:hypothetical protein